ncbi:hypothetical protein Q8A67_002140 [Cirrhinus molitorella]|uniref:Uncharacterized protein n=1 Tax=Cirrhinus molitorella TaxID=172907 RepID=A0AA88Q5U5_9TELE|nr:hypothetical protein Q8A67_002140 [Cirrhinus molitorella]
MQLLWQEALSAPCTVCSFAHLFVVVLTKSFQAGSLVTVKAPPPFCPVIPPLPSFAHIALPFGGKIPAGTSTVDLNSGIVLEKQESATHAGGIFFYVLSFIVQNTIMLMWIMAS